MKLVRFIERGQEGGPARWGRVEGEQVQPTAGLAGEVQGEPLPLSSVRLLAPADKSSKIVCVGRNYFDHIKELGNDKAGLPHEPGLFLKASNTLAEPEGRLVYPDWTSNLHYEGELAVIIAQQAKNLSPVEVPAAILGYTSALDLTARDLQKTDLQWFRAKSADRFCPLGPSIETQFDPTDVRLQTRLNGQPRQEGRTSHMIFDVTQILTYITRFVTLERGDVVLTGTPSGVGELQRGDQIEVEIDGLDVLRFGIEE